MSFSSIKSYTNIVKHFRRSTHDVFYYCLWVRAKGIRINQTSEEKIFPKKCTPKHHFVLSNYKIGKTVQKSTFYTSKTGQFCGMPVPWLRDHQSKSACISAFWKVKLMLTNTPENLRNKKKTKKVRISRLLFIIT